MGVEPGAVERTVKVARNPPERIRREGGPCNEEVDFEPSDINIRSTFISGVPALIGIWAIVGLIYVLFAYLAHERTVSSPPPLPTRPAAASRQATDVAHAWLIIGPLTPTAPTRAARVGAP